MAALVAAEALRMPRTLLFVALLATTVATAADLDAGLAEGAALAARGERAAARALFERLAAAHPDRPEPLNDLAALAAAEGDLQRARELLERALATHPSFRAVHDNLTAVYAAQAGAAYRKALPLEAPTPERPQLVMLTEGGDARRVAVPIAAPTVAWADREDRGVPVPVAAPTVEQAAVVAPAPAVGPAVAAASRPAPPSPAAEPSDARARAALDAVDAWIAAWVRRDVDAYLDAYADGFVPPDGLTRGAWAAQRAERIRGPKRIEIAIDQRHLVLEPSGARARMTFVQRYRSDRFNGDSFKTLTLVEERGRWRILTERTGR